MSIQHRSSEKRIADNQWRGPFVGHDRYGNADHEYWECAGCGVEVVRRATASHRAGCPHR